MGALNVKDLLLAPQLDRSAVSALLQPYGVKDPVRADANLQAIASDPSDRQLLAGILPELLVCISKSANPDQAITYLERFVRAGLNSSQLFSYLGAAPKAMEILVRSLGGSSYMAEILIRDPQLLYWVTDPQILGHPRRKREIQRDTARTAKMLASDQQQLDYLRSLKRREMLHLGVRDLLRLSSVEETWSALSVLAEALISAAQWICASALRTELGMSSGQLNDFTVIAMGKLGGCELNFSSDVDLMYLYAPPLKESTVDYEEYYRRLSQRITVGLSNLTGEGYVYRVDLRLRPEGNSGNIADSLNRYRRYYETRLAAWERLALIKAWPVAGNRALGHAFRSMAQDFIYKGSFGREEVDNILHMKRRIDEKVAGRRDVGRNVKLGPGGIREIELIVQSLQVCYGGRISQLRERSTLDALKALSQESLLSDGEYDSLRRAYVFLRDVENKLQMANDAQTHSLPLAEEDLAACASLLGYGGQAGASVARFEADYSHHTAAVRGLFHEIVEDEKLRRFATS